MKDEIKYKTWEGNLDESMHDCSVWLSSYIGEYSDMSVLDVVISWTGKKWIITVYYR